MSINVILLGTDVAVAVLITLAENICHNLLIESGVAWFPTLFILQLQVLLYLKRKIILQYK